LQFVALKSDKLRDEEMSQQNDILERAGGIASMRMATLIPAK
jgi:hypothetical protein